MNRQNEGTKKQMQPWFHQGSEREIVKKENVLFFQYANPKFLWPCKRSSPKK